MEVFEDNDAHVILRVGAHDVSDTVPAWLRSPRQGDDDTRTRYYSEPYGAVKGAIDNARALDDAHFFRVEPAP